MSTSAPVQIYTDDLRIGNTINLTICGVLGVFLNSLISWVLFKKLKKGGAHGDIKISTLVAATDLLVSIGLLFRATFSQVPYNIFKNHPDWCKVDALTTGQLVIFSGYNLGVISIERFLLICLNIELPVIAWFGLIFSTWTIQYVIVCVTMSEDLQVLTKIETSCTVLPIKTGYYAFLYAITMFFLSFFSVLLCYSGVMVTKFRQCYNQINLNVPKSIVYSELKSTVTKSLINIALYIAVYSGKFYSSLYIFITGKKITLTLDFIAQNLLIYSALVNSLILLYMNTEIRKSFFELLNSIKAKFFK
jgi:hypothetical protein